jgi:hypothetical protein
MNIKFSKIFEKKDIIKVTVLLVISIICLFWVWLEFQKPIIPPEWEQGFVEQKNLLP